MKAKHFLIKQNPFTKYKFCKKNVAREREKRQRKGKIKMSRTEMQKLTLPNWHYNLARNNTRKCNMLGHTVLHPQDRTGDQWPGSSPASAALG